MTLILVQTSCVV